MWFQVSHYIGTSSGTDWPIITHTPVKVINGHFYSHWIISKSVGNLQSNFSGIAYTAGDFAVWTWYHIPKSMWTVCPGIKYWAFKPSWLIVISKHHQNCWCVCPPPPKANAFWRKSLHRIPLVLKHRRSDLNLFH